MIDYTPYLLVGLTLVFGLGFLVWGLTHHWHTWGPWSEPYEVDRVRFFVSCGIITDRQEYIETCQQRRCTTCGLIQTRKCPHGAKGTQSLGKAGEVIQFPRRTS